jgi:hypothetical protein
MISCGTNNLPQQTADYRAIVFLMLQPHLLAVIGCPTLQLVLWVSRFLRIVWGWMMFLPITTPSERVLLAKQLTASTLVSLCSVWPLPISSAPRVDLFSAVCLRFLVIIVQ